MRETTMKRNNASTERKAKTISASEIDKIFKGVGEKLREGRSREAENLLRETIDGYLHTPDNLANLKRLLSFTFETIGKYKESFEAVAEYEDESAGAGLSTETQVRVATQLAIAYSNYSDPPKAVTLLKAMLEKAEANDLNSLIGSIDIALARVYRKLSEYPICRDYAQKALASFRNQGNWLGMAEAYREIANSLHQEGNSQKAIENFELGIKIIGSNSAPFMLGKLYTDMSGAYWFLRRPQDGIACLERSIEFFDRTEHALNSVIAYNNLGINLMLIGEWARAEDSIRRSLEIAKREDYGHIAGIYDSLGELKILRGDLDEAEELLETAVDIATRSNRHWYTIQSMRNQARCYLAKGDIERAVTRAGETIKLAREAGDKHHSNMAMLVLAEGTLRLGKIEDCEGALVDLEATDPRSDYFVLGNIQRIRGLAALDTGDIELAIHHFSRALTIFEAGADVYHVAITHHLLGENLLLIGSPRARKHLITAADIYKKLGLADRGAEVKRALDDAEAEAAKTPTQEPRRTNSVVSQLLTVRLAEATASRELLFRELIAVLNQESNARKMIIAQPDDKGRLVPFITHGYAPPDSSDVVSKLASALEKKEEKQFSRAKNIAVFPLIGEAARPAYVIINPASGATLSDGSSLAPLLRVVELGMDVVALREREHGHTAEAEISPYAGGGLMPGFIHSSPAMTALVEEVYKIRSSDVTVLVTGESGTGKELVAQAIHTISNRKDEVFIPVNCTALPKDLAEGQLFGYKKGAFTGATNDSPGLIRSANGGTLFLDEVGDLPLDVQPKLLRFLQEGEIQPLGERHPIKVDVRVIAATNVALEDKVAAGTFREDLYYRLNVIRLRVPPLRERRSEIPPIVAYYVNQYSERFKKHNVTISPQAVDLLMVCEWEGNVRQLCNEIQRVVARAEDGEVIMPDHISAELKRAARPLTPFDAGSSIRPIASYDHPVMPFANISGGGTLEEAVTELEMQMIRASLARNNWNISKVAAELGLTRRGLYLKLTRYGINKAA